MFRPVWKLENPVLKRAIPALIVIVLFTAACTPNKTGEAIHDPYEEQNRNWHQINKALDRVILSPASGVYGGVIPDPVDKVLDRAASNLSLPNSAVNHVLQGDGEKAVVTALRFAVNSTLGLAGMFDPAASAGLFEYQTGYGDTLGVWGFEDGAYVELPVFGPSTEREAVGLVLDYTLDPISNLLSGKQKLYLYLFSGLELVGDRHEYNDLIEVLLYESADSYAAQRISYLQNRSFQADEEQAFDDFIDPYDF